MVDNKAVKQTLSLLASSDVAATQRNAMITIGLAAAGHSAHDIDTFAAIEQTIRHAIHVAAINWVEQ